MNLIARFLHRNVATCRLPMKPRTKDVLLGSSSCCASGEGGKLLLKGYDAVGFLYHSISVILRKLCDCNSLHISETIAQPNPSQCAGQRPSNQIATAPKKCAAR